MGSFILSLIVVVELITLAQRRRQVRIYPDRRLRYDIALHLALLVAAALCLAVAPPFSGYIIGASWLAIALLLRVFSAPASSALRHRDFASAARWAGRFQRLMPWTAWGRAQTMYRCYDLLSRGEWREAERVMAAASSTPGWIGIWMRTQRKALLGEWPQLLSDLNQTVVDSQRMVEYVGAHRVRALAETEQIEAAIRELAVLRERSQPGSPQNPETTASIVCALAGKPELVRRLLVRGYALFPDNQHDYWLGVAWLRAGDSARGRELLEPMLHGDPLLAARTRARLDAAPCPALSPEAAALLDQIVAGLAIARPATSDQPIATTQE